MMDSETGRSKGYGFISVSPSSFLSRVMLFLACTVSKIIVMIRVSVKFADAECAKKALEQLNGFELAGRPMKVGHVTERTDASTASSFLDNDELERTGIDLGTTGRLQLMARLAEGKLQPKSTMEPLMRPGEVHRYFARNRNVLFGILLNICALFSTRPKKAVAGLVHSCTRVCWQTVCMKGSNTSTSYCYSRYVSSVTATYLKMRCHLPAMQNM